MKKLTTEELKNMTMAQIREWVDSIACAINRTSVMCWDHNSLFKGYNVKPEFLGYDGGRFIIEGFHFTSKARKADYIGFAEWLHWAIFGEYPTDETEDTTESQTTETTEEQTTEETTTESENMKDSMDWDYVESELWKRHQMMANKEEHTMKYDNCKNCGNVYCEHYGKDREFVCINGISCKVEKNYNSRKGA